MIYTLSPVQDDPRFEGFEGDVETFKSIPLGARTACGLDVRRFRTGWVAPEVTGAVRDINHYPCINFRTPAMSAVAISCLRELLEPNGEILPIRSRSGEYYFYNVTTVADVLDAEHSDMSWIVKPLVAGRITHYEFRRDMVAELKIFRIPETPTTIYVTQPFVDRVFDCKLSGFEFTKVWPVERNTKRPVFRVPLPDGVRENDPSTGSSAAEATAQSVWLWVPASSIGPKGGSRATILVQLADCIRAELSSIGSSAFALGHLEYIDDEEEGLRFYFSCADATKLVSILIRLIKASKWSLRAVVSARDGRYDNVEAREFSTTEVLSG